MKKTKCLKVAGFAVALVVFTAIPNLELLYAHGDQTVNLDVRFSPPAGSGLSYGQVGTVSVEVTNDHDVTATEAHVDIYAFSGTTHLISPFPSQCLVWRTGQLRCSLGNIAENVTKTLNLQYKAVHAGAYIFAISSANQPNFQHGIFDTYDDFVVYASADSGPFPPYPKEFSAVPVGPATTSINNFYTLRVATIENGLDAHGEAHTFHVTADPADIHLIHPWPPGCSVLSPGTLTCSVSADSYVAQTKDFVFKPVSLGVKEITVTAFGNGTAPMTNRYSTNVR